MLPRSHPLRLRELLDSTVWGKCAFDAVGSRYDELEKGILSTAYSLLAENLTGNDSELQRLQLIRGTLVFDILDDRNINAFATKKDGNDAIFVNAGLILDLYFLFEQLCRMSSSFDWLGDVAKDDCLPATRGTFSCCLSKVAESVRLRDPLHAQSEARWEFAIFLWRCSLLFVLYHELGHILHGHVDYFEKGSHEPFAELGNARPEASLNGLVGDELRRGQERQADRFATIATFMPLYYSATLPTILQSRSAKWSNRVPFTWGFAVGTIFNVFACIEGQIKFDRVGMTHPDPIERLFATSLLLSGLLEGSSDVASSANGIPLEMRDALFELDKLFKTVFGEQYLGLFNRGDNQNLPVRINLASLVMGRFAHQEEWMSYDRLAQANQDIDIRVVY